METGEFGMSKQAESDKLADPRPKYEPPRVLRVSYARARAGAVCVAGSSADGACGPTGAAAAGSCVDSGVLA